MNKTITDRLSISRICLKRFRVFSIPYKSCNSIKNKSGIKDDYLNLLLENDENLLLENEKTIIVKMADSSKGIKISDLQQLEVLTGKEEIPVALDEKNYKITTKQICDNYTDYTEEDLIKAIFGDDNPQDNP